MSSLWAGELSRWAASRQGRIVIGVARRSALSDRFAFCGLGFEKCVDRVQFRDSRSVARMVSHSFRKQSQQIAAPVPFQSLRLAFEFTLGG
ncbi:hypothetical protein [Phormidesmis priestleyi]